MNGRVAQNGDSTSGVDTARCGRNSTQVFVMLKFGGGVACVAS